MESGSSSIMPTTSWYHFTRIPVIMSLDQSVQAIELGDPPLRMSNFMRKTGHADLAVAGKLDYLMGVLRYILDGVPGFHRWNLLALIAPLHLWTAEKMDFQLVFLENEELAARARLQNLLDLRKLAETTRNPRKMSELQVP